MKKRILCTILTLALVLSATAMPAFAKTGEIYSFDFEETAIGQVTDKAQLDDYFTIVNSDYIKTYVEDSSVLHTQDSSLFKLKTNATVTATIGSYTVENEILTINKTGVDTATSSTYEIAYGEETLKNVLPTEGNYTMSFKLKTDFTDKQGIQLAFGGHFELSCTDADKDTLRPRYHNGSAWVDVKDNDGEYKVWSFADYTEVKFVVDATKKLTDLYIGDDLVVAGVPVRTNQSNFERIRIIANKSAHCTVNVKEINAYKADGSKMLKLDKISNVSGSQGSLRMSYSSLLNKYCAKDYTLSFDMRPELTGGSFNLAFGAFFEIARTADNVYTIRDRQGSATGTTDVKTGVVIDDFVKVKIKIENGKGNLYFDDVLIDGNVEYRTNYKPDTLQLVLNNGMKGSVYIDNIQLFVDSEQDVDPYVTGTYNLNSAGTGYKLNIKAFAPSDSEGNSFRAYVAYYADADQTEFLGATLQDVVPGELVTRGFGSSIPKGSKSANIMLLKDSLAPLCDYVTVELIAPTAE